MTPRSPWMASAGCRKKAAVPVLESVAAIFWQMMPDLPIPVRMTRPRHWRRRSTARSNRSSRRSTSARIAAASVCRTFRARPRSAMDPCRDGCALDDGVERRQLPEQWLERVDAKRVLRVAFRQPRVVVDLEKHAVHARAHPSRGERLDVLSLARRDAVAAARQLEA